MKFFLFSTSVTLHAAIYIFFVVTPFINRLRFKLKNTIIITAVYTVISVWLFYLGFPSGNTLPVFRTAPLLVWIALTILTCFICIKTNPLELLFSAFVILNIQANLVAFAEAFKTAVIIPYFPSLIFPLDTYFYPALAMAFIFFPMMWFLFIRVFKKVVEMKIDFRHWRYLWIIPLLFYIYLFISGFIGMGRSGAYTGKDFINLVLMNIISYSVYIICLQMLIKTHKSLKASEEVHVMEKQLEMQKSQYERLSENIVQIERVRHDLRQHFLAITGYAQKDGCQEIVQYIEDCGDSYQTSGATRLCANHALNIILCHYVAIAEEGKIKSSVSVNVPAELPVSNTDLCIVFGNLIENAVEACLRQSLDNPDRFIEIKTALKGNQLILLVKNSFDGSVQSDGTIFYSSKRKNKKEGIGISSVRSIVSRNDGILTFSAADNIFSVKAVINF